MVVIGLLLALLNACKNTCSGLTGILFFVVTNFKSAGQGTGLWLKSKDDTSKGK